MNLNESFSSYIANILQPLMNDIGTVKLSDNLTLGVCFWDKRNNCSMRMNGNYKMTGDREYKVAIYGSDGAEITQTDWFLGSTRLCDVDSFVSDINWTDYFGRMDTLFPFISNSIRLVRIEEFKANL